MLFFHPRMALTQPGACAVQALTRHTQPWAPQTQRGLEPVGSLQRGKGMMSRTLIPLSLLPC